MQKSLLGASSWPLQKMAARETMTVAVVGASGFVGRALCADLAEGLHDVRAIVRSENSVANCVRSQVIGDLGTGPIGDLVHALRGIDTVIHLAGIAHRPNVSDDDFMRVNAEGSRRVAEAAVAAGAKRLLFMSTIAVHGPSSRHRPFRASDAPAPKSGYGRSKAVAEDHVRRICENAGIEWTILRPPMIYGRGAPGNFPRLVRFAQSRLPLPLGGIDAKRAYVAIENVNAAIAFLASSRHAANRVFLVRDLDEVGLSDLLRTIGHILGCSPVLFGVPRLVLKAGILATYGNTDVMRILEPMQIDMSDLVDDLGWRPVLSLEQGLRNAVAAPL